MDQEREFRVNASSEYWETLGNMESDLDEAHHSTTWIAERALEQGNPDRALALLRSQRAVLKDHRFRAQKETLACAAYYMKGLEAEAEQACGLAAEWGASSEMWANLSNRGAMRLLPDAP